MDNNDRILNALAETIGRREDEISTLYNKLKLQREELVDLQRQYKELSDLYSEALTKIDDFQASLSLAEAKADFNSKDKLR